MAMPPPTFDKAATAQAPSRCSGMEIASVIVFFFTFLLGIGSLASSVDWSHDMTIPAISLCLILGTAAVLLAFVAARTHLSTRNALGSCHGPCLMGWHIAAWIMYVIAIINGLCAVGKEHAPFSLVVVMVIFMVIGWGLMITYTELARRRQTSAALVTEFDETPSATTGLSPSSTPNPNATGKPVTALSQSDEEYGHTQPTAASQSSAVSDPLRFQQDRTGGDVMARSAGSASARPDPPHRTPPVAFKDQCRTVDGEDAENTC